MLTLITALLTRSTTEIDTLITHFCVIFDYDPSFLIGLVRLSKLDFSKFAEFAERFGQCHQDTVGKFVRLLSHVGLLTSKTSQGGGGSLKLTGPGGGSAAEKQAAGAASAASSLANLTPKELFQMFDQDKSGTIDFEEFMEMLKYMHLPLDRPKALRIFSEAQKGDGNMGHDEFEKALNLINEKVTTRVLSMMGFSTATLLAWFIFLVVLVLALFAFIFLGIGAFTTGSTFAAVINSMIAVSAGGALGQNRGRSQVQRAFELRHVLDRVIVLLKKAL